MGNKTLILCALLMFVITINCAPSEYSVPAGATEDEEWEYYKTFFKKSYDTPEENAKRKGIYLRTKAQVEEHNKKHEAGETTYTQKINHFADLTQEEFRQQFLGGIVIPDEEKTRKKRQAFQVPVGTSLDDEWEAYKKFFNKNYDAEEEAKRKEIYQNTKKEIEEHNKKYEAGEETYSKGINQFADLTKEEFTQRHTGIVLPKQ